MPLDDKATRRLIEREIVKHSIDSSLLTVAVINNICYLGGRASRLRGVMGRGVDVKRELQKIIDAIELMRNVNDVVNDVQIRD